MNLALTHAHAAQALAHHISGEVLLPDDARYDDVRRVHNGLIDRRPAVIVRCQGAADVSQAIAFARQQTLEIAVRGGGHNVAGRAVCDGGAMIDLSLMKGTRVDPKTRRIWAQGGVTWGEFNRATQFYGLAATGGAVSSTGIAGLTLGGGFGFLMGKHGFAVDNLIAVELVTASGDIIHASQDKTPELFWALCGGGGNFGVATAFEFSLHPVGPIVHGGPVVHPFSAARQVFEFYRDMTTTPQDELTVVTGLSHAADEPGTKLVTMLCCHCGTQQHAQAGLEPIKSFAAPVADRIGPVSYSELNQMLDAAFPKLVLNYWKSCLVERLSDEVITILVEQYDRCPSPISRLIVEHIHGAATRRAPDATAFPYRRAGYSILVIAQWHDQAATQANIAWARETFARLEEHAGQQTYSNYLGDDETRARVRQAYGGNFARLQRVKDRYDPNNVFHLNQNIPPTRSSTQLRTEPVAG